MVDGMEAVAPAAVTVLGERRVVLLLAAQVAAVTPAAGVTIRGTDSQKQRKDFTMAFDFGED